MNARHSFCILCYDKDPWLSTECPVKTDQTAQRSIRVAKCSVLPTSDCDILSLNLTGGGIPLMAVWHFITESLSLSTVHQLDMT